MRHFIALTLIVGGLVHLLPVMGVLGTERLASLYGITIADPDLAILMRHRAALFGLLGGLLLLASVQRQLQPVAFASGLLSVSSFLGVAWSVGQFNAFLHKVVVADILVFVVLLAGSAVYAWQARRKTFQTATENACSTP